MRKPRILLKHAKYHVSARINRKEMLLDSARTKALFLAVLEKAKTRYPFRLENFTIMGNHFHLIIQPMEGANLSRIMQWILSVFAQRFNRIYNLTGHIWGERFFSRIISTLRDYLSIFNYIDENPVKAGLVKHCGDWQFGGLYFRRRGIRKIIDALPVCLSVLLPRHSKLLLEYQAQSSRR